MIAGALTFRPLKHGILTPEEAGVPTHMTSALHCMGAQLQVDIIST